MHVEDVGYESEGRTMLGRLVFDDSAGGPRPGVLIAHEAPGISQHTRDVAEQLALLGYVAFALDYQGDGQLLMVDQAAPRIGELMADPTRTQQVASDGLAVLERQPCVDRERLAVIGYCFGAIVALELGRAGADVKAIVGFHPGLFPDPRPEATRNMRGSVLMCCGSEDPFATPEQRSAFETEMRDAGVRDWRLEIYGGVEHSFTNPDADGLGLPGVSYNETAARRSWRSMTDLLDEQLRLVR
jgi:dienelactone hydrolase